MTSDVRMCRLHFLCDLFKREAWVIPGFFFLFNLVSMKTLFLFAAIFFSSFLYSQDTTRVVNHYNDGQIYDSYRRNAVGEKEGGYVQYSRFGKKLIVGQYNNGVPFGEWNYYSADTSGRLVQTLDFDAHKELFVDSIRMPTLICGPRYFGGRLAQKEYIVRRVNADFTKTEKEDYRSRGFVVSFSIDPKTLKVVGVSIEDNDLQDDFRNKLIRIVSEMPAWLPPVCKDKSEVWRFSLAIIF